MYEDPKSKISQLDKALNARESRVGGEVRRHDLHDHEPVVNREWDDREFQEAEPAAEPALTAIKSRPLSVKIFIGSVVFFLVAILLVAYNFLAGGNLVSGNNIEISVKAPISVSGGEALSYEVQIKNSNNTALVGADFSIAYPAGAQNVSDTSQAAKRVQEYLGDIAPGQTVKKNYSVALYGSENEKKDISLSLQYKIAGSNSLFNKTKTFTVLISSSPVSIIVSGPTEVNTNQTADYEVKITSNSATVIKGLLLTADYPFGFSFVKSDPTAYSGNNAWLIGDLAPGAERTIKISGLMSGQEGEERGFTFNLGAQSKADQSSIDTIFASSFASLTIKRPFVSADITLNGDSADSHTALAGEKVEALIHWRNNLSYEVSDVSIVVKLTGNSLNKSAISADGGFYRSFDNTITFNKTTNPELASLEPGQEGTSKFALASFSANSVTGAGLSNPTILLSVSVSGKRVDYAGGAASDVLYSDLRSIKITANPQLSAKATYYTGAFKNTGPVPPKSEQPTTYTVTWTVTNPLNDLTGTKVTATLPPYITWLSVVSPGSEKVSYDAGNSLVTWTVGSVAAGAGSVVPAREVSFQVSFTPNVDQIGTAPAIMGDVSLSAKDVFTGTAVADSFASLNTRLSSDPYFKVNGETVVQ